MGGDKQSKPFQTISSRTSQLFLKITQSYDSSEIWTIACPQRNCPQVRAAYLQVGEPKQVLVYGVYRPRMEDPQRPCQWQPCCHGNNMPVQSQNSRLLRVPVIPPFFPLTHPNGPLCSGLFHGHTIAGNPAVTLQLSLPSSAGLHVKF